MVKDMRLGMSLLLLLQIAGCATFNSASDTVAEIELASVAERVSCVVAWATFSELAEATMDVAATMSLKEALLSTARRLLFTLSV